MDRDIHTHTHTHTYARRHTHTHTHTYPNPNPGVGNPKCSNSHIGPKTQKPYLSGAAKN